jgi:hypothetical protein
MAVEDALDLLRYGGRFQQQQQEEPEQEAPSLPRPQKQPKPQATQSVANPVFSTLAGAGNLLDLPGSVARDLATWLPGGTKPVNPVDQILTPFSGDNRVMGRQLLRDYKLAQPYDTWGNFLGGFAVDVATDPLSYGSFGLTGAGKGVATSGGRAATKAGLTKGVAQVAKNVGKGEVQKVLPPMPNINVIDRAKSLFKKPKTEVAEEVTEAAKPATKPITERQAWSRTTPRERVVSDAMDAEQEMFRRLSSEADRAGRSLSDVERDAAREFGRMVGKRVQQRLDQAAQTERGFDWDTTLGGNWQWNLPFSSRGTQWGLPALANMATGKEVFIDGIRNAKRVKPTDEVLSKFDDISKYDGPVDSEAADAFLEMQINRIQGMKKPPKGKGSAKTIVRAVQTMEYLDDEGKNIRPGYEDFFEKNKKAIQAAGGAMPAKKKREPKAADVQVPVEPVAPVSRPIDDLNQDYDMLRRVVSGDNSDEVTQYVRDNIDRLRKRGTSSDENKAAVMNWASSESPTERAAYQTIIKPLMDGEQVRVPSKTKDGVVFELSFAKQVPGFVRSRAMKDGEYITDPQTVPNIYPVDTYPINQVLEYVDVPKSVAKQADQATPSAGGFRHVDSSQSKDYIKQGGWKLHLSVTPDNYQAVDEWLDKNHPGQYKLLSGGEPGESDFTVYVGDKASADSLSTKIKNEIGDRLSPIQGNDSDVLLNEKVSARFDVSNKGSGFEYYGRDGIPFDQHAKDLEASIRWASTQAEKKKYESLLSEHIEKIKSTLASKYGSRFSGESVAKQADETVTPVDMSWLDDPESIAELTRLAGDDAIAELYIQAKENNLTFDQAKSWAANVKRSVKRSEALGTQSKKVGPSLDATTPGGASLGAIIKASDGTPDEIIDSTSQVDKIIADITSLHERGPQIVNDFNNGTSIEELAKSDFAGSVSKAKKFIKSVRELHPDIIKGERASAKKAATPDRESKALQIIDEIWNAKPGSEYVHTTKKQGEFIRSLLGKGWNVGEISSVGPLDGSGPSYSVKMLRDGSLHLRRNTSDFKTPAVQSAIASADEVDSAIQKARNDYLGAIDSEGNRLEPTVAGISMEERQRIASGLREAEVRLGAFRETVDKAARTGDETALSSVELPDVSRIVTPKDPSIQTVASVDVAPSATATNRFEPIPGSEKWTVKIKSVTRAASRGKDRDKFVTDLSKSRSFRTEKEARDYIASFGSTDIATRTGILTKQGKRSADSITEIVSTEEIPAVNWRSEAARLGLDKKTLDGMNGDEVRDFVQSKAKDPDILPQSVIDEASLRPQDAPQPALKTPIAGDVGAKGEPVRGVDGFRNALLKTGMGSERADSTIAIAEALAKAEGKDVKDYLGDTASAATREADFDNQYRDTLFQSGSQGGFYYKLERMLDEGKVGGRVGGDQFKATAKKYGVKDEELEDLNIDELFKDGKPKTQQEIRDWLNVNRVELVDVESDKFSGYQVPGGEPGTYREKLITAGETKGEDYRGPHFEEPNVIAHVRLDDVALPGGKKALRVQELQSDWHQSGKKTGYDLSMEEFDRRLEDAISKWTANPLSGDVVDGDTLWVVYDENGTAIANEFATTQREAISNAIHTSLNSGIPDGPFKKSWSTLALKKVLAEAVEKGYDEVHIVKGSDIANAVGGPVDELSTFYDEILNADMKKLTKRWGSFAPPANNNQKIGDSNSWKFKSKAETGDDYDKYMFVDDSGAPHVLDVMEDSVYYAVDGIGLGSFANVDSAMDYARLNFSIEPMNDFKPSAVFKITPQMRKDILEQGQPLYQTVGSKRGATVFQKVGDIAATMHFFESANFSTGLHELAHVARRKLSVGMQAMAEKLYGVVDGKWTRDQEEAFALDFEKYVSSGEAPTPQLKNVFEKIKKWMSDVYQYVKQSDSPLYRKLTPEKKELFERMFGKDAKPIKQPAFKDVSEAASDEVTKAAARREWKTLGVRSSFFKRWFGDWENDPANASKVVDGEGKPLRVFHGTMEPGFDEFKNPYADDVSGDWSMFSESAEYSNNFAHGRTGSLLPVFLDIRNPVDLSDLPPRRGDVRNKILARLGQLGFDTDSLNKVLPFERDLFQFIHRKGFRGEFVRQAKELGFDGIKMPDAFNDGVKENLATTWVTFDPTQIKSAIGNTGEFSPTNPSILFQTKPGEIAKDAKNYADAVLDIYSELEQAVGESPVGRILKYAFNPASMGLTGKAAQQYAPKAYETRKSGEIAARESLGGFAQLWTRTKAIDERHITDELIKQGVPKKEAVLQARDQVREQTNQLFRYLEGFTDDIPEMGHSGKELEAWTTGLESLKKFMGQYDDTAKAYAQRNGTSIEDARAALMGDILNGTGMVGEEFDLGILNYVLEDQFLKSYFPRGMNSPPAISLSDVSGLTKEVMRNFQDGTNIGRNDPNRGALLNADHSSTQQRQDALRDVPGGTAMINDLSVDKNVSGFMHKERVLDKQVPAGTLEEKMEYVKANYPGWVSDNKAEQAALNSKLGQLITYTAFLDPRFAESNVALFSPDVFANALFRVQESERSKAIARVVYETLASTVQPRSKVEAITPKMIDEQYEKLEDLPGFDKNVSHVPVEDMMRIKGMNSISARQKMMNMITATEEGRASVEAVRQGLKDEFATQIKNLEEKISSSGKAPSGKIVSFDSYGRRHTFTRTKVPDKDGKLIDAYVHNISGSRKNAERFELPSPKNEFFDGELLPIKVVDEEATKKAEEAALAAGDTTPVKKVMKRRPLSESQIFPVAEIPDTKEYMGIDELVDAIPIADAQVLHNFIVPRKDFMELARQLTPTRMSEMLKTMLHYSDSYLNLWKSLHTGTLPFVAFHARNRLSGGFANMSTPAGTGDPRFNILDPRRFIQPSSDSRTVYFYGNALDALRGTDPEKAKAAEKWIEDNVKRLDLGSIPALRPYIINKDGSLVSPKEQMDALQRLGFTHEIVGGRQGVAAEQVGRNREAVSSQLPGEMKPMTPAPKDSTWVDRWLDPTRQKGVRGDETTWMPASLGSDLSRYVEHQNRFTPWLTLLRQGYDPAEAARIVKQAQVDYTDTTPFQREFLRRVFPFASFTVGATKHYGSELLDRPGGLTGQTIRAINSARDRDALAPEHILETAAIPMGEGEDGTRNYLTGFGLGFEDPVSFVTPALAGQPTETLRELLGRSNPLIKGPVEAATGVSLFQRGPMGARYLDDMDPTVGRTFSNLYDLATGERTEQAQPLLGSQGLEFLIDNSPISRYTNLARTLTDPRKLENPLYMGLNTLTGMRVNQVSPGAQDAIERGRIAREIKDMGGRQMEMPYLPDYRKEDLTDDEEQRFALLTARLKELAKRAKERRLAREQAEAEAAR